MVLANYLTNLVPGSLMEDLQDIVFPFGSCCCHHHTVAAAATDVDAIVRSFFLTVECSFC